MTKRGSSLAERYELTDLEPDVDPEQAADFLSGVSPSLQTTIPRPKRQSTRADTPPKNGETATTSPHSTNPLVSPAQSGRQEPWTTRTIRLRQTTATALTKAACGQKTKQAEGKVKPGQPVTVQEIAELGMQLALAELGYKY